MQTPESKSGQNSFEDIKNLQKCNKKPYRTERKAQQAFERHKKGSKRFGRVPPPRKIYQCECGYYHITTK